jgi:hypothetical protein
VSDRDAETVRDQFELLNRREAIKAIGDCDEGSC